MSARLFFALDVGDAARAALAGWAAEAVEDDPALRLVPEERLHVTLAFLGHRPEGEIEGLAALAGPAAVPVGELRAGGALWLAPRRPHVLTVAVEGDLAPLHERLWRALEDRGFERERRRFRPHVTVARVRRGARPATLDLPTPPEVALGSAALVLLRSHLGRDARYEELARAAV